MTIKIFDDKDRILYQNELTQDKLFYIVAELCRLLKQKLKNLTVGF